MRVMISDLELIGCCPGLWWSLRSKPLTTPQTTAPKDIIAALRQWSGQ